MLKVVHTHDGRREIGIDEAGRGCLWGPLVAGTVCWPLESDWTDDHRDIVQQIRDSKKLSPKKRERLYEKILVLAESYGVGVVDAADIDAYGATWANQTAFRRALDSLQSRTPNFSGSAVRYLIDGVLPLATMKEGEAYTMCVDGDAEYLSIAAASIVAKVWHDRWVREWCEKEENKVAAERYDLLSCKGYGTANHRAGLLAHGFTDLHRKLYLRKMFPDIQIERQRFHMVEDS